MLDLLFPSGGSTDGELSRLFGIVVGVVAQLASACIQIIIGEVFESSGNLAIQHICNLI